MELEFLQKFWEDFCSYKKVTFEVMVVSITVALKKDPTSQSV